MAECPGLLLLVSPGIVDYEEPEEVEEEEEDE